MNLEYSRFLFLFFGLSIIPAGNLKAVDRNDACFLPLYRIGLWVEREQKYADRAPPDVDLPFFGQFGQAIVAMQEAPQSQKATLEFIFEFLGFQKIFSSLHPSIKKTRKIPARLLDSKFEIERLAMHITEQYPFADASQKLWMIRLHDHILQSDYPFLLPINFFDTPQYNSLLDKMEIFPTDKVGRPILNDASLKRRHRALRAELKSELDRTTQIYLEAMSAAEFNLILIAQRVLGNTPLSYSSPLEYWTRISARIREQYRLHFRALMQRFPLENTIRTDRAILNPLEFATNEYEKSVLSYENRLDEVLLKLGKVIDRRH